MKNAFGGNRPHDVVWKEMVEWDVEVPTTGYIIYIHTHTLALCTQSIKKEYLNSYYPLALTRYFDNCHVRVKGTHHHHHHRQSRRRIVVYRIECIIYREHWVLGKYNNIISFGPVEDKTSLVYIYTHTHTDTRISPL